VKRAVKKDIGARSVEFVTGRTLTPFVFHSSPYQPPVAASGWPFVGARLRQYATLRERNAARRRRPVQYGLGM
jgi:hypothetical protein